MPRSTSKKKQKIIPPDPTRTLRSSTVLKGKAVKTDNPSLKDKKLYRLIKKQLTDDKGNKYIVEVEEEMDINVEEPSTTTSSSSSESSPLAPSSSQTPAPQDNASSNASPTTPTPENAKTPDQDVHHDSHPDLVYETVTKRTSFVAVTPVTNVKGNSPAVKKQFIAKHFAQFPGFTGKDVRKIKQVTYMLVYFASLDHMTAAIKDPLPNSDKDKPDEPYFFIPLDQVKPVPNEDDIKNKNNRTIQVIDIPLDIKSPLIRATFSQYGKITDLSTQTRGLYQHAFITFEDASSLDAFKSTWSVFIERHSVRVLPLILTPDEREQRKLHCLKLSGFRPGTTAYDLFDVIAAVKGLSCFIPRNLKTYRSLNYAFVCFADEQVQSEAAMKNFDFQGCKLAWCLPETRTCHSCGSPDHIVKNCPNRHKTSPRDSQLNRLYSRFRPANHRQKKFTSYADAAKNGNNRPPPKKPPSPNNNNNSHFNSGTKKGGSIHDSSTKKELLEIKGILAAVTIQLKELAQDYDTFKKLHDDTPPPVMASTSQLPKEQAPKNQSHTTATTSSPVTPPLYNQSNKRPRQDANLTSSGSDSDASSSPTSVADKISGGISSLFNVLSSVTKRIDDLENIKETYGTSDNVIDENDEDFYDPDEDLI